MVAVIKPLNENLRIIRTAPLKHHQVLTADSKNISTYEPHDLILFNPRKQPSDHLETKLSPSWLGPYEVVSQAKNNITVQHVVLKSIAVLQIDRAKPFFGHMRAPLSKRVMISTNLQLWN